MLSNVLKVALSKAVSKDEVSEASAKLAPGDHAVDAVLRIIGTIRKGEDYYQIQHMRCDTWAILAVALSKLNAVTMESIIEEALKAPQEMVEDVKTRANAIIEKYKTSKQDDKPTTGKVTKVSMVIDRADKLTPATLKKLTQAEKKPRKAKTAKVTAS